MFKLLELYGLTLHVITLQTSPYGNSRY